MSKIKNARRQHIAAIKAVLDLAERTERELDAEGPGDDNHGLLRVVAGDIVDHWAGCTERWSRDDAWTDDGIRAFVIAYAAPAPSVELADAAARAERRRDWCIGYAIATRYRNITGHELQDADDLEALARATRRQPARRARSGKAADANRLAVDTSAEVH